jgi:arabinogalactan oligomer/maltooligosaccharide transport system substrate-binding protein
MRWLGLALVAALVIACGRPVDPHTVIVWHAYSGAEQEALSRLVHDFHAQEERRARTEKGYHPIRVRLLQISFDNLPDKVTNAIPRGHGPDVFVFAHDRLGDWVGKGLVEPIGFLAGEPTLQRFIPKTLSAFGMGRQLYGLPLTYKSVALFYHRDLVGEQAPATTQAMVQAGRAFMQRQGAGHYGLVYEAADTYFHAPWLFGFGGEFLTPCAAGEAGPGQCSGQALPIVSPAAVKALAFARRLAGPGGIVPAETTGQLVTSLFTSKRAAMAISGPWFMSDLRSAERRGGLRYGVAPLPTIDEASGRRAAPFLSVEGVYLSRRSPRKARAYRLMEYLTSDAASETRVRLAGQLPVNLAVEAQVRDARSSLHSPALLAFRAQLDFARLTPRTPFMRVVWEPYKKALAATINRGVDPEASLRKAAQEIDRVLGNCLRRRQ